MTPRVAVLAAALLLAGCADGIRAHSRNEVIRGILPCAVQLHVEREGGVRRAGSGVVVASDAASARSWIVTTRHLLDPPGTQRIWASAPGRKQRVPAEVVATAPDADLAVIEVRGLVLPPAPLRESVRLGDEVWIVAYPWGKRLTVVSGVVSQLASDEAETIVEGPPRMVDASVSYGSSGGGVFDAVTGALIGIVEGYRTARVEIREVPRRQLDVPVPGETTVIASLAIRRFFGASSLRLPASAETGMPRSMPASDGRPSP